MKKCVRYLLLGLVFCLFCCKVMAISETGHLNLKNNINIDFVYKGIEAYSDKINADSKCEENYINRAYLNYVLGNLEQAIKDYDTLISLNPRNKEYFLNRGYLRHISNKRPQALEDYNKALEIDPQYAFAYNNKGVVLAEMGKSEASKESYDEAIKINPNYADAYYNRGNLNTVNNKNEEALEDFNKAIALNPSDSASFNNRGVVKRKLNYNVGALSDFTIAVALNPDDMYALANRGHLKKRYFDSKGAEEDFIAAVEVAKDSPEVVKQIEKEKELLAYQKPTVSSTTPVAYIDAPAYLNKALRMPKVSQQTKKELEAKKYNPTIAKTESSDVSNGVLQAGVIKTTPSEINNREKIATTKPVNTPPEITTKPVENPNLAECYYIRGLQKYILQNKEDALADFNTAIENNSNYADAYYYRAAIKRDLKQDSFVEDYQKAIALKPELKSICDSNVLRILKVSSN